MSAEFDEEVCKLAEKIDAVIMGEDLRVIVAAFLALVTHAVVELHDNKERAEIRHFVEDFVISALREGIESEMDEQDIKQEIRQ